MSDPNQSWRSNFSVSSLLPARHPPLHVDHPPPPTRRVPGYHTTTDTLQCPSPIRSAYASPSVYPETPYGHYGLETGRMSNLPPLRHAGRRPEETVPPAQLSPTKKEKHRPPPLNIAKINAVYPVERAVNDASPPKGNTRPRSRSLTPPVSPPILPPLDGGMGGGMSRWKALAEARNMLEGGSKKAAPALKTENAREQEGRSCGNGEASKGTIKKPRKAERHDVASEDPFDIAFVEPGLQYPSWHAPPIPTYTQPGHPSRDPSESEDERKARNLQNLQPGQVVPRHVLDSYHGKSASRSERDTVAGETYESVLHNVLLTPTYLRETPSPRSVLSSSDPAERNGRYGSRFGRARTSGARETLMAKAKRASRAPLALLGKRYAGERGVDGRSGSGVDIRSVSGSMRAMRAREEAEMDRFRRARPLMLASTTSVDSGDISPTRGRPHGREYAKTGTDTDTDSRPRAQAPGGSREYRDRKRGRSRERYDEESKVEYHQHHAYYNAAPLPSKQALIEWDREKSRREEDKARGSCWTFNITKGMDPKKVKKQQRKRKICIVLLILLLVGAIVGICLAFLLRRPSPSSSSPSQSSGSTPSNTASATSPASPSATDSASASGTASASPSPSAPPSRLQTCISQYASLSGDTSSYPCSECVPLLLDTPNDFTQDQAGSGNNRNNTGVGAALQFCALRDIVNAGDAAAFGGGGVGWGERDVCRWRGVQCDTRGRIEEITLSYPAVPYRIPTTISQIPTLKKVSITGNSSVPSGPFPSQLVTTTLTSLTLTDTALQGPIASAPWGDATELTTLYLANNPILGSGVPDLKANGKLVTLAMTGQLIGSVDVGKLPGSLTYLDLSYNSLSGQVPSFAELGSLQTLYLEHNSYTSPPPTLPTSLRDLRLNNNPSLSGSIPSQICGMTSLGECDLRGTGLGGNGTSCGSCRFGSG